jgi:spore germination cell wall hydrolase CwlJ-like protein
MKPNGDDVDVGYSELVAIGRTVLTRPVKPVWPETP